MKKGNKKKESVKVKPYVGYLTLIAVIIALGIVSLYTTLLDPLLNNIGDFQNLRAAIVGGPSVSLGGSSITVASDGSKHVNVPALITISWTGTTQPVDIDVYKVSGPQYLLKKKVASGYAAPSPVALSLLKQNAITSTLNEYPAGTYAIRVYPTGTSATASDVIALQQMFVVNDPGVLPLPSNTAVTLENYLLTGFSSVKSQFFAQNDVIRFTSPHMPSKTVVELIPLEKGDGKLIDWRSAPRGSAVTVGGRDSNYYSLAIPTDTKNGIYMLGVYYVSNGKTYKEVSRAFYIGTASTAVNPGTPDPVVVTPPPIVTTPTTTPTTTPPAIVVPPPVVTPPPVVVPPTVVPPTLEPSQVQNPVTPTLFTITATAGTNGTISPGTQTVQKNASVTYIATPKSGYQVKDILVDNVSKGALKNYTFIAVAADHAISVVFEAVPTPIMPTFSVLKNIGPHGSVQSSDELGLQLTSLRYYVKPDIGYTIASTIIDGIDQTALLLKTLASYGNGFYDFTRSSLKQHTLDVTFTPACYSINLIVNGAEGGTITNVGAAQANFCPTATAPGIQFPAWGNATFKITPNDGYHVSETLFDGRTLGEAIKSGYFIYKTTGGLSSELAEITVTNMDNQLNAKIANHTISITFAKQ